jgi:8-oxo-dGTP pyrophosphatase MutT (NUDIX family)
MFVDVCVCVCVRKFPGGVVDASDKSFKHTALRELHEEFLGLHVPTHVVEQDIVHFNTKLTRAVKNRRYRMYNFVALVEDPDAQWINDEAVERINSTLHEKRVTFESLLHDGSYWDMSAVEKEKVSPEVRSVAWFSLEDAIEMMDDATECVDEWQREMFLQLGIKGRDPMHVTAESLAEVRDHEDLTALRASAELFAEK